MWLPWKISVSVVLFYAIYVINRNAYELHIYESMSACSGAVKELKILFHTLKIQISTALRNSGDNDSDYQKVLFQLYFM